MSTPLLYNVLFAWKCSSTHHKLAMDALRHLRCEQAETWRNLFLTQIEAYLAGSKAPDNDFKDFKNHVLHVGENYWGGAVAATQQWYEKTKSALAAKDWEQVAYCAGVLSHYYSDPWQPFHTGQSEAEGIVHRAAEWSIACSYNELQTILEAERGGYPEVTMPDGADWLAAMVRHAANSAHEHYAASIDHYDIHRGRKDPPAGLDRELKERIAGLLGSAVIGFARILDCAIAEVGVIPPQTDVSVQGVLAQLSIPILWVTKKIKNAQERAVVEAMYRELQETGKVIKTLPEDDKQIRRLHAEEVLNVPLSTLDAEQPRLTGQAFGKRETSVTAENKPSVAPIRLSKQSASPVANTMREPVVPSPQPVAAAKPVVAKPVPVVKPVATSARTYLKPSDDVEKAPSIGPKTAAQLAAVGVTTVADLLEHPAATIAERIGQRSMTPDVILTWQQQSRLMCSIAGLRGHDAQLLVACGITESTKLAVAKATELTQRLTSFAKTVAGARMLRDSAPPELDEVRAWIAAAQTLPPSSVAA